MIGTSVVAEGKARMLAGNAGAAGLDPSLDVIDHARPPVEVRDGKLGLVDAEMASEWDAVEGVEDAGYE